MTDSKPRRPSGLQRRGSAFWKSTVDAFELSDSELALLLEACRTLDDLDRLAAVIDRDGATATGSAGQTVTHPALTEARGQRLALHRLLAALSLPDEDGESVTTATAARAKTAARARWKGHTSEAHLKAVGR